MAEIARLLEANSWYAAARARVGDPRPSRRLAVLTCMDARIDVFAALGLQLGEAHVIRNAGGRVTEDVLRSLALSTHVLGVRTVVVMQHTKCGLAGVTDEELRQHTGADVGFLPIRDHAEDLREDIELLVATPYLDTVAVFAGLVYDVETGSVIETTRHERAAADHSRSAVRTGSP
jgi:carbonic anhydrase